MARTRPITTGTDRSGPASGGASGSPSGVPAPSSDIADPGLALTGQPGIAWAQRAMPVLGMLRESFAERQPFAGLTVACCLHVTAETAVLVGALTAGGAQVHLAASNPLSTQDDIAAALAAEPGVTVQARSGVDRGTYYEHIHRVLDARPDLVMDDGGDLVNTLHEARPELIGGVRGGCEATSTGAARLRRMAAAGSLGFPVVAADVSATRRMVDHQHGTGQSVLDGIMRATNTLVAGKTVVVAGFGPCGCGIAERARGLGAQVIVTEVDPVRALGAFMQGFRVMPMSAAAPAAELLITATGSREVVGTAELTVLPDGAMLANAGHFDVEIDVAALASLAIEVNPAVRPHAAEYVLADGRRLILLAEGRVVNLVAGEGNPAAAMDTSFAVQALALAWLAGTDPQHWAAGGQVLEVPAAIDAEAASLALASFGTEIDVMTPAQLKYLDSWRLGS
jgi:adenosylhomocysteinase